MDVLGFFLGDKSDANSANCSDNISCQRTVKDSQQTTARKYPRAFFTNLSLEFFELLPRLAA
jgi:hypothetical protein